MPQSSKSKRTKPLRTEAAQTLCQGPVMAIGGAVGKDFDGLILDRFHKLAGGKRGKILVVPTATENQEETAAEYKEALSAIGAGKIDILRVEEREDANSDAAVEQIRAATGVFITGGTQSRLVSLLVGTHVMDELRSRNAEGMIVAGTSAGASILADHLLVGGGDVPIDSNGSTARRSLVDLAAGFDLLRDAVIDQHFSQRGRIGRLLSAFAAMPGLLALGIDEGTAALVTPDGRLEVLGTGSVVILDGRNTVSDYEERSLAEVLSIANVNLHLLGPGRAFDMVGRQTIPFNETEFAGPTTEKILAAAQPDSD
jgi:cyanophycinase